MPKGDDGQYELILETRQVLVIFVLAVILGAVFFGLGFVVGRHSTGPTGTSTVASASPGSSADKRSALSPTQPAATEAAPVETPVPEASTPAADAKPETPPEKPAEKPVEKAAAPPVAVPTPLEKQPDKPKPAPPPDPTPKRVEPALAPTATSGPIVLQVSAHGHREDAEPVVALLKRKGFPATIVTVPSDPLYHVQVGPYTSLTDAEAAKKALEEQGFKPYLKK